MFSLLYFYPLQGYRFQTIESLNIVPSDDMFYVPRTPPEGIYDKAIKPETLSISKQEKILPVQPTEWIDGCAGTSLGMIVFYYKNSYGLPVTKGTNTITSASHVDNYAKPYDDFGNLLPDNSIKGEDTHPNMCIQDFLETSRYAEELPYGASYKHMTLIGLDAYLKSLGVSAKYEHIDVGKVGIEQTKSIIENEINNNRPFMMAVDSSGSGVEDHAVVCAGYGYDSGEMYLVICDTWKTEVVYIDVNHVSPGVNWGISDL